MSGRRLPRRLKEEREGPVKEGGEAGGRLAGARENKRGRERSGYLGRRREPVQEAPKQ